MPEAKGACQGTEALYEAVNLSWLAEPLLVGTTRFAIDLLEDGKGYQVTPPPAKRSLVKLLTVYGRISS
jgi:hypothetical protein